MHATWTPAPMEQLSWKVKQPVCIGNVSHLATSRGLVALVDCGRLAFPCKVVLQEHYKNLLTQTMLLINTARWPPTFFMGLTEAFFVFM